MRLTMCSAGQEECHDVRVSSQELLLVSSSGEKMNKNVVEEVAVLLLRRNRSG